MLDDAGQERRGTYTGNFLEAADDLHHCSEVMLVGNNGFVMIAGLELVFVFEVVPHESIAVRIRVVVHLEGMMVSKSR